MPRFFNAPFASRLESEVKYQIDWCERYEPQWRRENRSVTAQSSCGNNKSILVKRLWLEPLLSNHCHLLELKVYFSNCFKPFVNDHLTHGLIHMFALCTTLLIVHEDLLATTLGCTYCKLKKNACNKLFSKS